MGSKPVGISASRGASVLGLSEYQSIWEVWQRICEERRPGFNASRGYVAPEEPDNAAIRWGRAFEDAIVELASAKVGCRIGCREEFWSTNGFGDEPYFLRSRDTEMPNFITCHLDGRYCDDQSAIFMDLHEGKTTSLFNFWDSWGKPGTDRIPQGYQVQVQHQMLCTGANKDLVSVLVFPRRPEEWESEGWEIVEGNSVLMTLRHSLVQRDKNGEHIRTVDPLMWARVFEQIGCFHQYPVAASPTLQRALVDAYSHFWHTYVLTEKEPDLASYDDVRRAFPEPVGTIVVTEQEEAWLRERKMIADEIKDSGRLGKRKEELKVLALKSICARMGKDAVIDTESQDKVIFRDGQGNKLGSFDGKTFR